MGPKSLTTAMLSLWWYSHSRVLGGASVPGGSPQIHVRYELVFVLEQ